MHFVCSLIEFACFDPISLFDLAEPFPVQHSTRLEKIIPRFPISHVLVIQLLPVEKSLYFVMHFSKQIDALKEQSKYKAFLTLVHISVDPCRD